MLRVFVVLIFSIAAVAQQPSAQQTPAPDASAAPSATPSPKPVVSPTARLNAAKTVYIKRVEAHNDIPFNVIANGFDGWAKYMVVSAPEKADLIIEVSSTEREEGFVMPPQQTPGIANNKDEPAKTTNKTYSVSNIRM